MSQPDDEKTALVTGASGGIGYELTKLFARDGYNLVLVARNAGELQKIAEQLKSEYGISVKIIPKDLASPDSPREIFDEIQADGISIDILINNAGFGAYGSFRDTNLKDELEMMQVNMVSSTHLTKIFLPGMISKGYGRIMNVSSMAAFQPGPLVAVYCASKSYVLSFSEALAEELSGTGVTVTALCPGPVSTGFAKRAKTERTKVMISGLFNKVWEAKDVAAIGYHGLMKGKTVVIPGKRYILSTLIVRWVPRKLVRKSAKKIMEESRKTLPPDRDG
ncbi:MAG: SDR family oxidoreductase [Dehalococcoidia bacterium]